MERVREQTDVNWSDVLKARRPSRRKRERQKKRFPKPDIKKLYGVDSFMELQRSQMYKIHRDYMKHYYSYKKFREAGKHRRAIEVMELNPNIVFNENLVNIGEDEEFLAIQQEKEKERHERIKHLRRIRDRKKYRARHLAPGVTAESQKKQGKTPINPSKRKREEE